MSVTDLCNLRCTYCMPESGICKVEHGDILSIEELAEIGRAAVDCGVRKIRLSGGEPLVRRGILDLCRQLRALEGLDELVMTTNGVLLKDMAADLKAAGVDRLNVSLDTLNPEKYRAITRNGRLEDVFDGLRAMHEAGFGKLKINVVLVGGFNDDELVDFVNLTREYPIAIRFIELMPIGACTNWPRECFIPAGTVLQKVPELQLAGVEGVAEKYRIEGAPGSIGLIHPMSHKFCCDCNRVRVTADGKVKPCLHSKEEFDLKGLKGEALRAAFERSVMAKPERHYLNENQRSDSQRAMYRIGG